MLFNQHKMQKVAAAAIALILVATPLAGCGGQQKTESEASDSTSSQSVAIDTSSWKTLGDAFATQTEPMVAANDDNYCIYVFRAGNSIFRVVAKMDAETKEKIDDLVTDSQDIWTPQQKIVANLPLRSVEDLSGEVISQDELDGLVGKTGKELGDMGFAFQNYYMYGGEQAGATFAKGYLAYMFTFEASVPEDKVDDDSEGALVMDAKVLEAEFGGVSDAATDPAEVR